MDRINMVKKKIFFRVDKLSGPDEIYPRQLKGKKWQRQKPKECFKVTLK